MPGPGGVLPYLNIDQEQCEPGYNGKQWLAMVSSAGCDIVQTQNTDPQILTLTGHVPSGQFSARHRASGEMLSWALKTIKRARNINCPLWALCDVES